MPAGIYDFIIERGETFTRVITWKDENSTAINLTGYTARMQLRGSRGEPSLALSLTTENSGISLGGIAGTITITISASQTASFESRSYVYDLELVAGSGAVTKLLKGVISIAREVTV